MRYVSGLAVAVQQHDNRALASDAHMDRRAVRGDVLRGEIHRERQILRGAGECGEGGEKKKKGAENGSPEVESTVHIGSANRRLGRVEFPGHYGPPDAWLMRHASRFLAGQPRLKQVDSVVDDHALN